MKLKTICTLSPVGGLHKHRAQFVLQYRLLFIAHDFFEKKCVMWDTITHGFEQKIMCYAKKIIEMCPKRCKFPCQTILPK
jgi:hypothetical protein